ncbi:MAG: YdcF family protein [Microbacterium sp.]
MTFRRSAVIASIPLAAVGVWLWAEFVDERASRRCLGTLPPDRAVAGHDRSGAQPAQLINAVVVLGYRNRGDRINVVNRFRVRAGIRSLDPDAAANVLVLCGGAVGGRVSEAVLMEHYARTELHYAGSIVLDSTSRSTWENIDHAIPFIEHAATIKIVSNAPHAELGRQILWQQRPDLAERLVRGAEHRFGETPVLKILAALRAVQSQLSGAWRAASRTQE